MATQERIDALKGFCQQWLEQLENAEKRRTQLLFWQSQGLYIYESGNENMLPSLIAEADRAVQQYKKILIRMESIRDRAVAGEEV